jgi:hypothetical protein
MDDEPRYGPHRWSAGHHDDGQNTALRGARFEVRDLRGARFVDCDLTGAKVVDGTLVDLDLTGYVEGLRVNGVDVTDYVRDQLDSRQPWRAELRQVRSADDFRSAWGTVEQLWDDAIARARRLPPEALDVQVDGEWSFLQTLRHLVFITDSWISRTVLDEPSPFHPLALPQSAYAADDAAALGMDVTATPTADEVLAALASRRAVVRQVLDGLADDDLGRPCHRSPAPGYPEGDRPVWECLQVLVEEEGEHHGYAVRDLAALEARHS